jgi:hypothetical protein
MVARIDIVEGDAVVRGVDIGWNHVILELAQLRRHRVRIVEGGGVGGCAGIGWTRGVYWSGELDPGISGSPCPLLTATGGLTVTDRPAGSDGPTGIGGSVGASGSTGAMGFDRPRHRLRPATA